MIKTFLRDIKQGRNLLSFMVIKGLGRSLIILIPLLATKILAPEIIGSFFLFKMIIFFASSLLIAPFTSPFNIESNREYASTCKSNKTFTSFLTYAGLSIMLFSIIFIIWGRELINFTGLDYHEYRIVFILAFLGVAADRFLPVFFLGQNKKKIHAILGFIFPFVHLLYIVLLYFTNHFNLKNILLGYPISGLVILIITIFYTNYQRILPLSFSGENFKELGRFSSWVALGVTVSYFINWGDNIVLKYFVSLSNIGVYNLGYQFFKAGLLFHFFICHYYTPFLSQQIGNKKAMQNYLSIKRKKTLKYIFLGFIAGEIMVGYIIRLFFDPSYYGAIGVVRILLISNLLMSLVSFYLPIFSVVKKYKLSNLILIAQLIVNVVFNIILIPHWGIIGAAIATTTSYLLYVITIKILFETQIKKTLNNIWSNVPS